MRRPFITALGAKTVSRNVAVRVQLAGGLTGWGEGSASLALPQETQPAMLRAIGAATPLLEGRDLRRWAALIPALWERAPEHPTALSAVEIALLDAFARSQRLPLYRWFGGAHSSVTTDLTLSAWPPARAAAVARAAFRRGFRRFKIKVGTANRDADAARVAAVRRACPRAAILLDANQGFTVAQAERFLGDVQRARVRVALLEQPVAAGDLDGLAYLTRRLRVPVAADETVRTPTDARRVIRRRAARVINVKVAKSGVLGALAIMRLARAAGLRLMLGCMAESRVGLSASVHLACGTGAFAYIDLDSGFLTGPAPARGGFTVSGPRLSVSADQSGTGIIVEAGPGSGRAR